MAAPALSTKDYFCRPIAGLTPTVLMGLLPDHICQISRFNAINIHRLLHINHEDDILMLDGYAKPLTIGEKYKDYLRGLFLPS